MSSEWGYNDGDKGSVIYGIGAETGRMTLTEFLLARIAEDEAVARAAVIPESARPNAYKPHPELSRWRYVPDGEVEYDYDDPYPYPTVAYVTCDHEGLLPSVNEEVGPHIARHDPARVLAECAARRAIVALHARYSERYEGCSSCGSVAEYGVDYPCDTLRALALPYADHPDYDEARRP